MALILTFLRLLLNYVSIVSQIPMFIHLSSIIPKSLKTLRNLIHKKSNGLCEFVVCSKCHALYEPSKCIVNEHGQEQSKCCDYVEFPRHPQSSRRLKCNTPLMKWVRVGGKSKLVPCKTFLYHSVIAGIGRLLQTENFLNYCELWRNRSIPSGVYCDIYDGKVWQDFQHVNGIPFLADAGNLNLCLTLNVDWFNPYEETQYSVGAIYLVVQNLPRSERFKVSNIILVGLIPGPKEPKSINPYLDLLVDDLRQLFHGVNIPHPNSTSNEIKVRALLTCVVCDLPATRKLCGFLGVNATKGCSKCKKSFPTVTFGSKPDYSGYECSTWRVRTHMEHYQHCILSKNATTPTECNKIEKENGARYTELLRLHYFDIVRFHVVDPMHNLFLGLAKHTIDTWKSLSILKSSDFALLQSRVDAMVPPPKIGRIPRKIGSGFSSFTAEEWKNWTLIFSVYALKETLPSQHYSCWLIFVKACTAICQLVVTHQDIENTHEHLIQYCKQFERLYGKEFCTPNMHMACHIGENMFDFGPLSAFWAFTFECYNGTLENTKLSWSGPEKQMLTKFLDLQLLSSFSTISSSDFFKDVYQKTMKPTTDTDFATVQQTMLDTTHILHQSQYYSCPVSQINGREQSCHKLLPPVREKCFTDLSMTFLQRVYALLYPEPAYEILHLERFYYESKQIVVNGEEFITTQSRSQLSAAIIAHWPGVISIDENGEAPVRVGVLISVFRHSAIIRENRSLMSATKAHIFAQVKWLEDHPYRHHLHQSVIISATTHTHEASFIPLSRIIARCAIAQDVPYTFDFGEDRVCIAIPLLKKLYDTE